MERQSIRGEFYIDDHAVLFGLLCKNACEQRGEKGLMAAKNATILYAKERGLRMAQRALANGDPLIPKNYLAYGEWLDHKKWSQTQVESITPEFHFSVVRCGWNDTWKKYGLEKYGIIYCSLVDKNLAFGFNPQMKLQVNAVLSPGHEKCDFHLLGADFSGEEDMMANSKKQAGMAEKTVKDFLYHTGHLLSAMRRVFYYEMGLEKGDKIVKQALQEYGEQFGLEKTAAVIEESKQDFLEI
ncbi:MAG: L-2-amino-thiazoline-4-carboxylic acid hydrolase [Clostridiales bacterium]|nr:L-2-amino-thiazoline-4-carboxylic acid hydrolase [Clostridiales bacterium]